jgi:hypothetical protein
MAPKAVRKNGRSVAEASQIDKISEKLIQTFFRDWVGETKHVA